MVTWSVRWRAAGRGSTEHSRTFGDESMARVYKTILEEQGEDAAEAWLDAHEASDESGEEAWTLDSWMEHYLRHMTAITDGTRHQYRRRYETVWSGLEIEPGRRLGSTPLHLLRRDDIRASILLLLGQPRDATGKPLGLGTLKVSFTLLSQALREAVQSGALAANPCTGIRLPKGESSEEEPSDMVALSPSEFALIHRHMRDYYKPLVLTLYATGMRWGEATALQVKHVDFSGREIRVTRSWKAAPNGGSVIGAPKAMSRRVISVSDEVLEVLHPLVDGQDPDDLLFGSPVSRTRINHRKFFSSEWLPAVWRAQRCEEHMDLPNPCGCSYPSPRACKRKEHYDRALPLGCGCPGTLTKRPRLHDLRHSHASWLLTQGVSPAIVSKRLGHRSISITVDVYGHMMPESQELAASVTSEALGGTRVPRT